MDSRKKLFKGYNNAIITGENGSGKSILLNEISNEYTDKKTQVIGIANTIYDRFNKNSKFFNFFGPQSGKHNIQKYLKKAILETAKGSDKNAQNRIRDILEYINYKPKIGVSITPADDIDIHSIDILEKTNSIKKSEKEIISKTLYDFLYSDLDREKNISKIEWINFSWGGWSDYFSYNHIEDILLFIKHENSLIKHKLIKKINIHLQKDYHEINIENASSGEITFLTSMLYISTTIKRGGKTIILIDEPENSLHPSWQKDYLKKILDLFSLFEPRIIIATHSPLLISGAEQTDPSISIYGLKRDSDQIIQIINNSNNIEALIWDFFGITTPESHFVSQHFVKKLNMLGRKKITFNEFKEEIYKFIKSSNENEKQINTLNKLIEIAKEIEERKINND